MQEFLPSTKEAYIESIKEYGEVLEIVVIEDVFMPPILKLLSENKEQQLLEDIFKYFEEIVNSDDIHLIKIFVITVLEILGNDKLILENAKQYMGTKTTVLQIKADEELGRA
ncbi:MAG: resolvase [Lachnospiraceae bacterium]|nr:resolvase [Lachnospiraceae bacterium]